MRGAQRTIVRAVIAWLGDQHHIRLDDGLGRQEQIEQLTEQFLSDEGRRIWAGTK